MNNNDFGILYYLSLMSNGTLKQGIGKHKNVTGLFDSDKLLFANPICKPFCIRGIMMKVFICSQLQI